MLNLVADTGLQEDSVVFAYATQSRNGGVGSQKRFDDTAMENIWGMSMLNNDWPSDSQPSC